MVKNNLPASAGEMRFNPWSGNIPHALEQLSPCATTTVLSLKSLGVTTTEAGTP